MDELGNTNQNYDDHSDEQNIVIFEKPGEQVRLTVSEFRGNYYFGMRLWLEDIKGEWFPTKSGFSFPYNIDTTATLFSALTKILSRAEVLEEVQARAAEISAKQE